MDKIKAQKIMAKEIKGLLNGLDFSSKPLHSTVFWSDAVKRRESRYREVKPLIDFLPEELAAKLLTKAYECELGRRSERMAVEYCRPLGILFEDFQYDGDALPVFEEMFCGIVKILRDQQEEKINKHIHGGMAFITLEEYMYAKAISSLHCSEVALGLVCRYIASFDLFRVVMGWHKALEEPFNQAITKKWDYYRTHDQVKKYIAEEEALVESRLLRIVCTVIKEQDIDAVELQTSIDAIVSWLVEESHGKNQRVNFEFLSGVLGRIDKISNATEFELVIPMNSLTNAVACALGQLAVELQEKDDDYYIEDVLKRVLEDYLKPMATRLLDQSGQEDILRSMVQRAKTQHVGTHYKYMVIVGGIKILGLRADLIKELDISQAEKEILAVELGGPADLIVQYQEKERKRQEEREIEYLERKQKLEQECEVEFPKEKAKRERAEKEFQKAIETLKQNN